MAAIEPPAPTADASRRPLSGMPGAPTHGSHATQSQQSLSATPIEMNSLPASGQSQSHHTSIFGPFTSPPATPSPPTVSHAGPSGTIESQRDEGSSIPNVLDLNFQDNGPSLSGPTTQTSNPSPASLTREQTVSAIGPATDQPTPLGKDPDVEGPFLFITLLLASTGARHPYKLDARYMKKRNVEVEDNNPINMSLYKLKELILRDWRSEWDAKPSSPESIRLIFMGKMLNDKARLADIGFNNGLSPQIVHMAIKPQEIVDEEEANKAIGKDREGNERSPGCRCVIQ